MLICLYILIEAIDFVYITQKTTTCLYQLPNYQFYLPDQ
jgi:hypothetical protein